MEEIYLFNPDHDLAQAQGGSHYIAPEFARQLQHDLAVLPMWYAPSGAMIVVPDEATRQWAQRARPGVRPIVAAEVASHAHSTCMPWGWNLVERKRLIKLGASPQCMPQERSLRHLRDISHRRTTIVLHRELERRLGMPFSPIPQEFSQWEDVQRFAQGHPGCYVKTPWSGSGQGVYHVIDPGDPYLANWCKGALRRQGSLLCEVGLKRTMDFALEYYCDGQGGIDMAGYSIFSSDFHSQYSTALVDSPSHLHGIIAAQYPAIDKIGDCLQGILATMVAPHYHGYLGIDMLLYRDGGETKIDPCVEMNLRSTMGVVTSALGKRLGRKGQFKIAYSKNGFQPREDENRLYLTPILAGTQYCAYIGFSTV